MGFQDAGREVPTPSPSPRPRIYVLGVGSIGGFTAHCLAESPLEPEVILLLHGKSFLNDYIANESRISLETNEGQIVHHGEFRVQVLDQDVWYEAALRTPDTKNSSQLMSKPVTDEIQNLILSCKTYQTVSALRPLRHRLGPGSTILFLQNGSGVVEAVSQELFKEAETRPKYMLGVISHGVATKAPFNLVHTGVSATSIGAVPRENKGDVIGNDDDEHSILAEALCKAPRLNARSYMFTDIFQIQLEKLAMNALSNPVCALHDSNNEIFRTMPELPRQLMEEISAVVLRLPELKGVPGVAERFSASTLQKTVLGIIEKNAKSVSSMVWDLRWKRKTEVEFINGYWCKRGREVSVSTPLNDDLVRRIQEREKSFLN